MFKKAAAFILSVVLLSSFLSASVNAALDQTSAPSLNAGSAILLNINTDEILYEKNPDEKAFPASSVKIMTALLVYESISDLDETVVVPAEAISKVSGNNISIVKDEVFTVRQLLYAMLVYAANDAACVLAYHVAGSIDGFVELMNRRAAELGASNTVYTNPTGLHDAQMVTTARDTAMIAKYVCCISTLVEISSTPTYTLEKTNKSKERTLYNKSLFVASGSEYYYAGAKSLNSGSTTQAGYTLITMTTQKGMPLLCVVLSCDKTPEGSICSYTDSSSLYKWAFASFDYVTILKAKLVNYEMPVRLSAQVDYVLLYPDRDIEMLLPLSIDVNKDIRKVFSIDATFLEAPVKKDTVIGEVVLLYNDEVLATAKLLTANDVERSDTLYYLKQIDIAIHTIWFKVSIITFFILSALYFFISYIIEKKKNNENYLHRYNR